jgi:hypothetical protein
MVTREKLAGFAGRSAVIEKDRYTSTYIVKAVKDR